MEGTISTSITSEMTEKKLIDDTFYIEKGRFLWNSYDKEGKPLISALTEQALISATHFYLKGLQDGFADSKSYEGVVGGKL